MNRKDRRAEAARQRHAKAMVGMEIRYGGRTLVVTVYVNTDEEPEPVAKRIEIAARGPKAAMAVVTAAVLPVEQSTPIWSLQGITTFFEGRTIQITAYVNTDESLDHDLTKRVMNAANKPGNPKTHAACGGQLAATVTGGEAPIEDAREMWKVFFKKLELQKDGPN